MNRTAWESAAWFEHRFWLRIMGDHARFIRDSALPAERSTVESAESFVEAYDRLGEASSSGETGLSETTRLAISLTTELREFKLDLIRNHMVNEAEEYLRVAQALADGSVPAFEPVRLHLLRLSDAVGHAASIAQELDFAEVKWIGKAKAFEQTFRDFYLKAVELAGYMRTMLRRFPALSRFNKEVE